jgi:hypothetical protein
MQNWNEQRTSKIEIFLLGSPFQFDMVLLTINQWYYKSESNRQNVLEIYQVSFVSSSIDMKLNIVSILVSNLAE